MHSNLLTTDSSQRQSSVFFGLHSSVISIQSVDCRINDSIGVRQKLDQTVVVSMSQVYKPIHNAAGSLGGDALIAMCHAHVQQQNITRNSQRRTRTHRRRGVTQVDPRCNAFCVRMRPDQSALPITHKHNHIPRQVHIEIA